MKPKTRSLIAPSFIAAAFLSSGVLHADIDVPTDGSDGALVITKDTEIDLSLAASGKAIRWDTPSPTPGNGVYDPEKWAVVFKYSSVNIAEGATVTFRNHASRAPVVWLVQGDVEFDGTVDVSGRSSGPSSFDESGPGGFRGSFSLGSVLGRGGFGPGGGLANQNPGTHRGSYGNAAIVPLMGGSGAGIHFVVGGSFRGQAGGGAILVASRTRIVLDGSVTARAATRNGAVTTGGGGAIRLVTDVLTGTGSVNADVSGRVRIEAQSSSVIVTTPATQLVAPATPPQIWPASEHPTATLLSVGGEALPVDPRAEVQFPGADSMVEGGNNREILVETTNLDPATATVSIRVTPAGAQNAFVVEASHVSGNADRSTWSATVNLPEGYSALQVIARGE